MAIAESKKTAVILINCKDSVSEDACLNTVATHGNILEFNCGNTGYIEPLLSAFRTNYLKFDAVSFVTNNVDIQTELTRFFPELFRSIRFIEQMALPLARTELVELMSVAEPLPSFELSLDEPLVSEEFERLKGFFLQEEHLTGISAQDVIRQLTDAFMAAVSAQHCAFSVFVQIRLLSFYSDKLNKYGDAYFKSLSLKCGDANISAVQLWQLTSDKRYSANERYFIYNQIVSLEFNGLIKEKSKFLCRFNVYKELVEDFGIQICKSFEFIEAKKRNQDVVFVFISQFLGVLHAPTKIALDMAKDLSVFANKQVVLIDTCELLPASGALPWYDPVYGNRATFNDEIINYQGISFNYLRLSNSMPNTTEISGVVDLIRSYKPYFTITIGESITADICSKIVPNVVISTISRLPHTISQFRVIDEFDVDDVQFDCVPAYVLEGIIKGRVIRPLTKDNSVISREDLALPKDKFLIAVVGNRLDSELNEDFFEAVLPKISDSMLIVFIGEYSRYQEWCTRYPKLSHCSYTLGYQRDLASVMAVMDVFLNPPRLGGGAGACYALEAGVPVLTLRACDVYYFVGEDFSYNNLHELVKDLENYSTDSDYRVSRQSQAKDRFIKKMDSALSIKDIINRIEKSNYF